MHIPILIHEHSLELFLRLFEGLNWPPPEPPAPLEPRAPCLMTKPLNNFQQKASEIVS